MQTTFCFYKSNRPLTEDELTVVRDCFHGFVTSKINMHIDDLIENEEVGLQYIDLESESDDDEIIRVFLRDGWTHLE